MNCVSSITEKSQSFKWHMAIAFSVFLPVLTFYEIYYSTLQQISHSTLSNKWGILSTKSVEFLAIFSLHI